MNDVLNDALSNLEHDNYELSYQGYKDRQADIALIRATLAAQPAASAEPSVAEPSKDDVVALYHAAMTETSGGFAEAVNHFARALLSRYGRPAGDAQPVRWVHTLHSEHDDPIAEKITGTPKNPFGKPRIDYDPAYRVTSEPLYAAPVAAQKADDARDAERIRNAGAMLDCLTSKIADNHPLRIEAAEGAKRAVADLYRIADRLDAAIAQQRKGE